MSKNADYNRALSKIDRLRKAVNINTPNPRDVSITQSNLDKTNNTMRIPSTLRHNNGVIHVKNNRTLEINKSKLRRPVGQILQQTEEQHRPRGQTNDRGKAAEDRQAKSQQFGYKREHRVEFLQPARADCLQ